MTLKTGVIAAENSALHHKNKLRYLRILFDNSLSRELTAFLLHRHIHFRACYFWLSLNSRFVSCLSQGHFFNRFISFYEYFTCKSKVKVCQGYVTCLQCEPDPNSVLLIIMPSRKIQMRRLP